MNSIVRQYPGYLLTGWQLVSETLRSLLLTAGRTVRHISMSIFPMLSMYTKVFCGYISAGLLCSGSLQKGHRSCSLHWGLRRTALLWFIQIVLLYNLPVLPGETGWNRPFSLIPSHVSVAGR
jgi:hypothetical protein